VTKLKTAKTLRILETALLVTGLALLAIYGAFRIYSRASSRAALHEFAVASAKAQESLPSTVLSADGEVDVSLWSEKRVVAYRQSLGLRFDGPAAVLRIPSLRLEVPVFEGTDDLILNRGAGRIIGTAAFGLPGNIGIAGHRDGFFRCLKDIRIGDRIELAMLDRKTTYAVESIQIVTPDDVSVLQPRDRPAVTLVTCYPFYFVGDAPKRYIVRASIAESDQGGATPGAPPDSEAGAHKGQATSR
jgi:sortase A